MLVFLVVQCHGFHYIQTITYCSSYPNKKSQSTHKSDQNIKKTKRLSFFFCEFFFCTYVFFFLYISSTAFRQTELDGVRLDIWDTAGQERYQAIAPLYYRGANVAVIVYDVTNKESLSKAKEWYTKLQEEDAVGEDVVVAIAGNKCDCTAEQRTVPLALGESFAANNNLLHFETSAKTGQGVREMFSQIVQNLPAPGNDVDDGKVDMSSDKKGKKKGCC